MYKCEVHGWNFQPHAILILFRETPHALSRYSLPPSIPADRSNNNLPQYEEIFQASYNEPPSRVCAVATDSYY